MINRKKVMCIKQNTIDRSIMKQSLSVNSENDNSSSAHLSPAPISPVSSLPVSPGGSKTRKSKKNVKSVRFNQSVTSRPFLHKNNYTKKEIADCWFSPKEYELIRRKILKTLRLMRTGTLFEDDADSHSVATIETTESTSMKTRSSSCIDNVYCARGLENFNTKGTVKSTIVKLRQNAIWAVLEEQDLQVDRAECLNLSYLYYNHDALRDVYRDFTKAAAMKARRSGIVDRAVASGKQAPSKPSSKHRTFRQKLFKKSNSDKDLKKTSQQNSPISKPKKQQRRWTLLSSRQSTKSAAADAARSVTAMMVLQE